MISYSIRTKYSGPTETRGSRIIVTGPGGQRSYSYDYGAHDAHDAAAIGYLSAVLGDDDAARNVADGSWGREATRAGNGYRYPVRPTA